MHPIFTDNSFPQWIIYYHWLPEDPTSFLQLDEVRRTHSVVREDWPKRKVSFSQRLNKKSDSWMIYQRGRRFLHSFIHMDSKSRSLGRAPTSIRVKLAAFLTSSDFMLCGFGTQPVWPSQRWPPPHLCLPFSIHPKSEQIGQKKLA